jgi:type II secretory pathway pseudopilin PulG
VLLLADRLLELMQKMMNRSSTRHHKILGSPPSCSKQPQQSCNDRRDPSEGGYSLVALMALMTIVALFAMAVAPGVQQQSQRDKEKEAIFRGEQVAEAIREYYKYRNTINGARGDQALPTNMDQLLQGVPIPGGSKTRQILRASAARDPLTLEGEWRLIHPRTDALIDFQQAVLTYAGAMVPTPKDPQMAQLQQFAAPQLVNVISTGTTSDKSSSSLSADDSSGPFVGVASRSRRSSVLAFYGLESHEEWIFTPLFRN